MPAKPTRFALLALLLVTLSGTATAQTRVEFHLLPPVSTGPMDPAWSPDGRWIAFSMRGDIWKVPAAGGEAIALTEGPDYHFEPAWSPDGRTLALVYEIDGDLEIGVVSAEGGPVQRITNSPGYDLEPVWGAGGRWLYFVSRRERSLDIYRVLVERDAASTADDPGSETARTGARASTGVVVGAPEPIVAGPGNQFHPDVSPDGAWLAFVAPVEGKLGSGGIWVAPLADDTTNRDPDGARLVHYEETSYRARPRWSADGKAIFYSSEAAGSNDIAVVPAAGGNRVRLTEDPLDEFGPAVSPDGTRIAFVSNHDGPTTLYTMSTAGGARRDWDEVEISSRVSRVPIGKLRGRLLGSDGQVMPGRIMVTASDGRAYTEDGGFHRMMWVPGTHYAHTDGTFEIEVPAGPLTIEAMRGFEYTTNRAEVDVSAGNTVDVELTLGHLADGDRPADMGWYGGDTHVHDLHEGRFGLDQEMFFRQVEADDLRVTNALIHMDGTKLMGRWIDLTGMPFELSTREHILYYTQEFRGSFGHVALLGLKSFVMPLIGGAASSPYSADVLKIRHIDAVHEQGGIAGFVHPYNGPTDTPERAASADIPVHVALGKGDFFDVVSIASRELDSAAIYYRLLNCGFRIAATGGTDNFSDVWLDPSGGTARTYAHLLDGSGGPGTLTYDGWLEALRAGRTFGTSGPLLFLNVYPERAGVAVAYEPGDEITLGGGDSTSFDVEVAIASIVPLERAELIVNGEVGHAWEIEGYARAGGSFTLELDATIDLPGSGWIAARAFGPPSRYIGDAFPFAQTSPVYVVRDGLTYTSVEDAQFLLDTIDLLWERVRRRDSWNTEEQRRAYESAIEEAHAVYQRIIEGR